RSLRAAEGDCVGAAISRDRRRPLGRASDRARPHQDDVRGPRGAAQGRPRRPGHGLDGRAPEPDAHAVCGDDAGNARREEPERVGTRTEDHDRGSGDRVYRRIGVRGVSRAREGNDRPRTAGRHGDPERRHLPHRTGADQGRQGAHDDRRRPDRPSAQPVTTRALAISALAGALALLIVYAGLRWGALVAGGADSYGYVSQAELWRRGALVVHQDVVRPTPWPFAAETWTPLGYRPSPHARDGYVPIYAPGLPLLMAAAQALAGFCAAFAVVPLCGGLTIWLTFSLGRRIFQEPAIALGGAVLVAASPVFLYQLMNAMSDVPVTAAWTLALVLAASRRPFGSGLAMAATIAIRPNLA